MVAKFELLTLVVLTATIGSGVERASQSAEKLSLPVNQEMLGGKFTNILHNEVSWHLLHVCVCVCQVIKVN